jgi:argininosuccinate lyase
MSEKKKNQLWAKGENLDQQVHAFTVGDDYLIDLQFITHDCVGSAAHAIMLSEVSLLTVEQKDSILKSLAEIYKASVKGDFVISPEQEDSHTAIEAYLTEKLGEAGKRIHVGRSRNDQVLLNSRLFTRSQTVELIGRIADLAALFAKRSTELFDVPMPGLTHLQRAMPSSVGMWLYAFMETSMDLIRSGFANLELLNRSPLGAGAGFGVSLFLDRERTAELLGFASVQRSPIDCQNSRGREELRLLRLISDLGTMIEKICWDLQLGVMEESQLFTLPLEFTTGSSIMPQKRNPDVLELLRGRASSLRGAEDELRWIVSKLPSNYHRDFQLTKPPLVRAIKSAKECVDVLYAVIKGFTVNESIAQSAMTDELYATYDAFRAVKEGKPFREAYSETAEKTKKGQLDVESLKKDWEFVKTGQVKYLKDATTELTGLEAKITTEEKRLKLVEKNLLGV